MLAKRNRDAIFIFLGDFIFFYLALYLAILLRSHLIILYLHILPFTLIFFVWALVFYIADLYGRQMMVMRRELPWTIIRAQLSNVVIAVLIFYFVPYFLITPRAVLFLDLLFTSIFIFFWRLYIINIIYRGRFENVLIIGTGTEVEELTRELNENPYYHTKVIATYSGQPKISGDFLDFIKKNNIGAVIVNLGGLDLTAAGTSLYNLFLSGIKFFDLETIYEEVFDRVPLSLVGDQWFLEYVSASAKRAYTFLKRLMDIIISFGLGLVSFALYPLIMLAIKLDAEGPIFITQERVGRGGQVVRLTKFRTMKGSDLDQPTLEADQRITRVGRFLRRSRLDELPQLWNVLQGRLSLVGPRPELPFFVDKYQKEIPYYNMRHIIQPGLSGWAQIHFYTPAYDTATNSQKLAYELYYLKNRSFLLDLKIALKTVRILLSRKGI